jgi:hypothetical protein
MRNQQNRENVLRVRYEDLCSNAVSQLKRVCEFLAIPFTTSTTLSGVHPVPSRMVRLSGHNVRIIERIAGDLNRELYADEELNQFCG